MAVRVARHLRAITAEFRFFAILMLAWAMFLPFGFCSHSLGLAGYTLYALVATSTSFLALQAIGYFKSIRLRTRKSDAFLIVSVVPLGAMAADLSFSTVLGTGLWSCKSTFIWSFIIAGVVFCIEYGWNSFVARFGGNKKVVLDLLPEERQDLIENLEALGLAQNMTFLDRRALRRYLARGAEKQINFIAISSGAVRKFEKDAVLLRAHISGVPVIDYLKLSTDLSGRIRLNRACYKSYLLEARPQTAILRAFSIAKVLLEPLIALALAVALSPLLLLVAVAVKLTSPGPVLFRQVRTGYLGKPFTLVKFRSMRLDAESKGPQWSNPGDARVTGIGNFLRKTRLDELPQLLNIIKGEMSFFGPRPERPEIYAELQKQIPLFEMRNIVRPGVTGWAQVCAGYAASIEESKMKLEFDLYYIQNMSPRLDLIILLKTLKTAVFGTETKAQEFVIARRDMLAATNG